MAPFFKDWIPAIALVYVFLGHSGLAAAQPPAAENKSAAPQQDERSDQTAQQTSMEMREMARAMKSMAEMCQTMMEKEMQRQPFTMVAVGVVGTLITIALILFVVLEIQWIRFWNVRIKTEKKRLEDLSDQHG